jgi:hypothetical protein
MTLDGPSIIYHHSHSSRDKVIINDLDAELAEIEASEAAEKARQQEQAFFLPEEYEKEITSVPDHVLRNSANSQIPRPDSQALILYRDPTSISIPAPEEGDSVRKAIIEARKRMRERQHDHDQVNRDVNGHDDHMMDDLQTNSGISTPSPLSLSPSHPSHESHLDSSFKDNIRKAFATPPIPQSHPTSTENHDPRLNHHKRLPSAQLRADSNQRRFFPYGNSGYNPSVKQPTPSGPYISLDHDLEDVRDREEHAAQANEYHANGLGHGFSDINGFGDGIHSAGAQISSHDMDDDMMDIE